MEVEDLCGDIFFLLCGFDGTSSILQVCHRKNVWKIEHCVHTCYGIQEVYIYVAMTDCTECSEANRGDCDSRNELATTTLRVQEDTISGFSVYKVELRWAKFELSRSRYLWEDWSSIVLYPTGNDTPQLA